MIRPLQRKIHSSCEKLSRDIILLMNPQKSQMDIRQNISSQENGRDNLVSVRMRIVRKHQLSEQSEVTKITALAEKKPLSSQFDKCAFCIRVIIIFHTVTFSLIARLGNMLPCNSRHPTEHSTEKTDTHQLKRLQCQFQLPAPGAPDKLILCNHVISQAGDITRPACVYSVSEHGKQCSITFTETIR